LDKKNLNRKKTMNIFKQEIWFLTSQKIAEERVMLNQIQYLAQKVLFCSEKNVDRRFKDMRFTDDQWRRMYSKFGDQIFTAFTNHIKTNVK